MNRLIFFLIFVFAIFGFILWPRQIKKTARTVTPPNGRYMVVGTGNPGKVILYTRTGENFTLAKSIDTGFQFVHTVRLGDIYNNGSLSIIAGVSNSFYRDPYGCKVIAYDLSSFQQTLIDDVGDLRCKDLTIGDAENNGKNAIVLGTHGEGLVKVYTWIKNEWQKTTIEINYIAQIDAQNHTNHRVPNSDVPCPTCLIQTAVHIVKIGDIDNDGKNEIITTDSSPLELKKEEEISFIRVYRKSGDTWTSQTIDSTSGQEFRSITIADVHGNGKNTLLVGLGSPRNNPGSFLAYDFTNGVWEKTVIHKDDTELNMKGVDVGEINGTARSVLLATGFPNANIMTFHWDGKGYVPTPVGSIRTIFNVPNSQFNSMVAAIVPETKSAFVVAGNTVFPQQNIGWETTNKGFLVLYLGRLGTWTPTILSQDNVLALDVL